MIEAAATFAFLMGGSFCAALVLEEIIYLFYKNRM